jgi:hypothetical protein
MMPLLQAENTLLVELSFHLQNAGVKTDFIPDKYRFVKYHAINRYRYATPARGGLQR